MDKEFYDKYGKELDCKSCIGLQECSTNSNIPLCDKGYRRFAKDKIAELEQQLEESFTEEDVEGLIEDREKTIKFLQQQLAEKDTRIAELEDKDWYEACIKQLEEQNDRLIDKLKEKDKEIEKLNKTLEMCKHIERYDIGEMFLENAKLIIEKRQFAIQELEKVKDTLKHFCNIHNDEYYGVKSQVKGIEQDVCDQINQQISELKGEKDDKN